MADDDIIDEELEPSVEPKSSKAWLALLNDAEKAFDQWQSKADNIDKLYADLGKLASGTRDREFAMFWANIQVLGPSIYARPPVPVVVPKFKDRRPLYRVSSELLERVCNVVFDLTDINGTMLLLRDDLTVVGRGVPWVRYETKAESDSKTERVCIEFKNRRDFLHEPARIWQEVGWVAAASYLSKKEMRQRFAKTSGTEYKNAVYAVRKEDRDNGAADNRQKAKVWEVWSKTENRVVWVAEGCEKLLDDDKPHLKLEGFFPCPRPAYATTQRGSLIPVPDMLYYKDQLEEINSLTARIAALAEAIKVRGFYPAGGEIGDAVATALSLNDDRKIMVPVSNWAAFGQAGAPIVWLPIDMIATTLEGLVKLRRQVIDDVYQIMGLSDIMRGSTEAQETATAQQIKAQYGSVRIRDKQAELVRVARDCVRIVAEVVAENFASKTMLEMSQMEIPTDADISKQVKALEAQAKAIADKIEEIQADPASMQQAEANPEEAQQMLAQATGQIQQLGQQAAKLKAQPTVEKIMEFLRDQKTRPFVLDIETDSTIAPDEQAEKAARTEFVTALGGTLQQFMPLVQQMPQAAPLFGEILKFALGPFRAGRELEGKIDEAVEQMTALAQQPRPDPEAQKAQAQMQIEQQKMQFEAQKLQAEQATRQEEMQIKAQIEGAKAQAEMQLKEMDAVARQRESDAKLQQLAATMERDAQKGELEMRKLQMEIQRMQVEATVNAAQAAQQAEQSERSFEQQSALNAQKAAQGNEARP